MSEEVKKIDLFSNLTDLADLIIEIHRVGYFNIEVTGTIIVIKVVDPYPYRMLFKDYYYNFSEWAKSQGVIADPNDFIFQYRGFSVIIKPISK